MQSIVLILLFTFTSDYFFVVVLCNNILCVHCTVDQLTTAQSEFPH